MTDDTIVIASARRTPIGAFQGALSPVPAPDLGATAASAAARMITKIANIRPSMPSPLKRLKATKLMFAAFRIISIPNNT